MDAKGFGRRVLLSRLDLGWNQGELAAISGISNSWISNIETGKVDNPKVELVEVLAAALGVTAAYLLGYTENPLPEISSPSAIADSHVVYEVEDAPTRRSLQRLLDDVQALDAPQRELVCNLAAMLRSSATPRIIGNESD